jgi:tetratricopeptide (TPR) repeat protein
VEQQLAGKEYQEFQIALRKGDYAKLVVEQRSIRVKQACFGPDGKLLFEDETFAIGEPQNSELIANASGNYRIRVTASEPTAASGRYAIRLEPVEPATPRHQSRVAAARAYARVTKIENPASPEYRQTVIAAYQEALTNWRAAGDLREEARTLYSLGPFLSSFGERQKGLDLTMQGLAVARASGDHRFEAWALHYAGEFHNNFGDKRKAIEYAERSLPLMRETSDRGGEAVVLNGLAVAYSQTGEKRKDCLCSNSQSRLCASYTIARGWRPRKVTLALHIAIWVSIGAL